MADSLIRVIIQAVDKASKTFKDISKNAQGMGTETKSSLDKLTDVIGTVTKVTAAAAATALILKKAWDFGEQGAQVDRLAISSTKLANTYGADMSRIVSTIQKASLNTISEYDAMASASRAMMLGLGADANQLGNLTEIAAFRGRAMGLSTQQAFDDIVRGIGRMSPLILDNLGIIIDAESNYKTYAASIGKTADQLTAMEKRQALLNAVLAEGNDMLEKAGGLTADLATGYERVGAKWQDFSNDVKRNWALLTSVFVLNDKERKQVFREEAAMLGASSNNYKDYVLEIGLLQDKLGLNREKDLMVMSEWAWESANQFENLAYGYRNLEVSSGDLQGSTFELNIELAAQAGFMDDLTQARSRLNEELEKAGDNEEQQLAAINKFGESVEDVTLKLASMAGMSTEVIIGLGFAFGKIDEKAMTAVMSLQAIADSALSVPQKVQMTVAISAMLGSDDVDAADIPGLLTEMLGDMGVDAEVAVSLKTQLVGVEDAYSELTDIAGGEYTANVTVESNANEVKGDIDALQTNTSSVHTIYMRTVNTGSSGGGFSPIARMQQFGGEVIPGQAYIVGERRPEIFVPNVPGRIEPNVRGGTGGGAVNITFQYAPMISTASRAEALEVIAPLIEDVIKDRTRGRVL